VAPTAKKKSSDDAGQAEVQAKVSEAEEKGYEGWHPRHDGENGTPNSAYSLEGGAPKVGDTPESSKVHPDKASVQETTHSTSGQ